MKYIIVVGCMPNLIQFTVPSSNSVKRHAKRFLNVIPDDLNVFLKKFAQNRLEILKEYEKVIEEWDAQSQLLIEHKDDEHFYFRATREFGDEGEFDKFIKEHKYEE